MPFSIRASICGLIVSINPFRLASSSRPIVPTCFMFSRCAIFLARVSSRKMVQSAVVCARAKTSASPASTRRPSGLTNKENRDRQSMYFYYGTVTTISPANTLGASILAAGLVDC